MSEWIAQGNKPTNPDFKGEVTEFQQQQLDMWEAQERLAPFLSVACRNCVQAQIDIVNPAGYKVAMGELTKEEAIKQVVDGGRDCTGPQVNERYYDAPEICPRSEREKKQNKRNCF